MKMWKKKFKRNLQSIKNLGIIIFHILFFIRMIDSFFEKESSVLKITRRLGNESEISKLSFTFPRDLFIDFLINLN